MKNTKRILALLLALIFILAGCVAKESENKESTGKEITVKVEFDTSAVDYSGKLKDKSFEVKVTEGASLFDATKKCCEENGLEFNYDDSATFFITGIGDLNMGDMADTDGWMFTLNGEEIWETCDTVTLKDGDTVTWLFMIW